MPRSSCTTSGTSETLAGQRGRQVALTAEVDQGPAVEDLGGTIHWRGMSAGSSHSGIGGGFTTSPVASTSNISYGAITSSSTSIARTCMPLLVAPSEAASNGRRSIQMPRSGGGRLKASESSKPSRRMLAAASAVVSGRRASSPPSPSAGPGNVFLDPCEQGRHRTRGRWVEYPAGRAQRVGTVRR